MALKKIKDLKGVLTESLLKSISKAQLQKIAEAAADMIRVRTRKGFGVKRHAGQESKLKPLSKSYIAQRKGEIAFFTSDSGDVIPYKPKNPKKINRSLTSPGKSNLTFSGQMLDSLTGSALSQGKAIVKLKGTRDDKKTNAEVGEFVSVERPFMRLSGKELKKIADILKKDILQRVNQRLKK